MSTKPTGLSAFTRKGAQTEQPVEAQGARKRAQGDTVALTTRLPKSEWARLHQLAVSEGVSLQTLSVRGFDKVLADHGLPPIRLDVKAS
jgi:hypothetical protein